MPYVQPLAPGFRYGLGTMQGAGEPGQLVRLAANNVFVVNDDPTIRSFGMLEKKVSDGEMPGVFCNGGIYETDCFVEPIGPDDELSCDATTGLLKTLATGDRPLGQALFADAGVLRFKLYF